ncbi:glutamine synthetase/guanido kinase [Polychaeton citri CBS 116435]|uniref:Glutamine synthetase/guanido kinase n=1 Tax=Polychaeton citri CBS 116435 TaxID=1314669 RepID=A0A9P4UKX8_9PEZI|nr:glutamine synthetase/guanido kinase [Polychaeton citri CBS 116435]
MAPQHPQTSVGTLQQLIRTCPTIDNHAHNLLRKQHDVKHEDLLATITEASGQALVDTPSSLPFLRAVWQLNLLYELPETAEWSDILTKRKQAFAEDGRRIIQRCLSGTHTILVDDGLDNPADFYSYDALNAFTAAPCKRIVRIETVAADILKSLHQQDKLPTGIYAADEEASALAWVTFITSYEKAIVAVIDDDEVVGFKSVVCYRTGLDVAVGRDIDVTEAGLRAFRKNFLHSCVETGFRVEAKGMCDALVISTCKLLAASHSATGRAKSVQFHTGLGDNDISLFKSNPALLQPLIKEFPTVPIVLLHASYPYTRCAGYLATMYSNVYLDIGLVFPMVSRSGQESVIRQALEITPTSKILWSTDGHHYPEAYYLAAMQGRQALERVFTEMLESGDLTADQSMRFVKAILFENSNELYGLGFTLGDVIPSDPDKQKNESPVAGCKSCRLLLRSSSDHTGKAVSCNVDFKSGSPRTEVTLRNTKYVFVQWLDYVSTIRTRVIPIDVFNSMKGTGEYFSISYGNLGTLQDDSSTELCSPVGSLRVKPDLHTYRPLYNGGSLKGCASLLAGFVDDAGSLHPECPRSRLQEIAQRWRATYSIDFQVGFEIEFIICHTENGSTGTLFQPLDTNHAWSTFTDEQYCVGFPLMSQIVDALQDIGITPQAFHSEAGAGQYEIVLPPLPLVEAVDTLIQARQLLHQVVASNGLRATLHPLPFPGLGSAAHAHISLNSTTLSHNEIENVQKMFLAGLLKHLPALCGALMPNAASYGRVAADHWTSGLWVAWGEQNREVPIRKSGWNRWEIRCLDGLANMYIALSAVLGAGMLGVRHSLALEVRSCPSNPSLLNDSQLTELGVTTKLPININNALDLLESDSDLMDTMEWLGADAMLRRHIVSRRAEDKMLAEKNPGEKHTWLIQRY